MSPPDNDSDTLMAAFLGTIASLAQPLVDAPVDFDERWPVLRTGERAPISRGLRQLIYERDRWACAFCDQRRRLLELDHIIPWSARGPDTSDNLRSLCHDCNQTRSNYRTELDIAAVPVTLACDDCIRTWIRNYGVTHYGRCIPDTAEITAFCGNCHNFSTVTDPARLK